MSYSGKDGVVKVSTTTVAEVTDFDYDEEDDLDEDTAKGDANKSYKVGYKDGGGTITCHFDPTNTGGQKALRAGATVTLTLYPNGTAAAGGNVKLSGSVIIQGHGVKSPQSGIMGATFRFKGVLAETAIT